MTKAQQIMRTRAERTESLRSISDAYLFLLRLDRATRGDTLAAKIRTSMAWYRHFLSLAAAYPRADQDALVTVASRVFRVRIRTLRADLNRAMPERGGAAPSSGSGA
jgi:hypothetical protein